MKGFFDNLKISGNIHCRFKALSTLHLTSYINLLHQKAQPLACIGKTIKMLTAILILAGLLGFAIFFKAIDFFDKI